MGELEVGGAEAIEESDQAIGVAAALSEIVGAEGPPGARNGTVEFLVANAAEDLGVSGGTASSDGGDGAALAEDETDVEGLLHIGQKFHWGHSWPGLVNPFIHNKGV